MTKVRVLVSFRSAEQGGRKTPFQGSRYATVARVRQGERTENWSVVIDFERPVVGGAAPILGTLTALFPGGESILRKGADLELTEGPRTTASAHIEDVLTDAGEEDAVVDFPRYDTRLRRGAVQRPRELADFAEPS